ncbi:glutathione S-transferase [Cobetia sp. MC34]|uniref:glutathione S-transferase family protein n=1 Tax=Cobetia sp. MC34 TaxID=2785080 RepID=UPI001BC98156|nr:glutathione S-transferase [Cobetia sp. MC34]MBS4155525.1 glutathione S-transferase [Cobetia sp. MC34]
MMIHLHHLIDSRSIRILWLLEEIGHSYKITGYSRDAITHFAPSSLLNIHALGKSPVVNIDGEITVESGAITEIIISRFAGYLAPSKSSKEYFEYLEWIHFSESSAMLPILLKIFNLRESSEKQTSFLEKYAEDEFLKVFCYLDDSLKDKKYIVGDRLTGADFMLVFVIETALNMSPKNKFPNLINYIKGMHSLPSYKQALDIENKLRDGSYTGITLHIDK